MIPLRDENPSQSPPVVTRLLIVANVLAFGYQLSLGPQLPAFIIDWGMVPARLQVGIEQGGQALVEASLPLFTSMFLHGGFMHLLGNMWYLWIFGDNVEDRLGKPLFLVFYLVAGIAAGVIHFAFNPTSSVPAVGASGAIAGVLGAYLVAYPHARVIMLLPLGLLWQLVTWPAVFALGLWFVFQFFAGAFALFASAGGKGGAGIAWWAHIGGFAFGGLVMLLLGGARRSRARVV